MKTVLVKQTLLQGLPVDHILYLASLSIYSQRDRFIALIFPISLLPPNSGRGVVPVSFDFFLTGSSGVPKPSLEPSPGWAGKLQRRGGPPVDLSQAFWMDTVGLVCGCDVLSTTCPT